MVPDVACDFTQVKIEEVGTNVVRVTHCRGLPPTATYGGARGGAGADER
eukprot:gene4293-7752_t